MTDFEQKQEAPTPNHVEGGTAPAEGVRAHLDVHKALLDLRDDEDSLSELFGALRPAFAFDRAMVLEAREDGLCCIAAEPKELTGRTWSADLFPAGLVGDRVFAGGQARIEWQPQPDDPVAPAQPVLSLPIGISGRRATLVMLRSEGRERFGDDHVALARQCAVVALAALAARTGPSLEAEIRRLNRQIEELRRDGQQPDGALLREIVNRLPIGLTVQDDGGRFILVNEIAADNLQTPAQSLIGASPADFLPEGDAAMRRNWELELVRSGRTHTTEETLAGPTGARTWLTFHNPVRIGDRTLLVASSLDITERKQLETTLLQRANYDELTGLPNGVLVRGYVEEIARRQDQSRFALAIINFDNFKHINDYYSHAIGDALLAKIARRIKNGLRGSDLIARLAGDEFLLLLDPVDSEVQLRASLDRVLHDLKQPFYVESFEILTSASVGVSIHPEHGTGYEMLRRNADAAMYRAKTEAKGTASYFDLKMGQAIAARMQQEQRLRLAIRDRRLCCAFQPKVDIRTQDVVGFETLVRWRDEDGEIHLPSSFVDLAIQLGLIDPITRFVLEEALRSIGRLDEAFGPGTTLSVNVAARQANDLNFMRAFIDTLKASQYAERIMIELTEDAFVAKSQFQKDVLPMLRDIGVRVSIDDFGTGFSSLGVLAGITADELKVDRSFITSIHERPRSQDVLRAIESLGQALGMTIVAEGVETFEEVAFLQAATQIRYAQGFYFSKPFFLEDAFGTKELNFDRRDVDVTREHSGRREVHSSRGAERARSL